MPFDSDPALFTQLLPWRATAAVACLAAFWTWESLWPFFGARALRRRHAVRNLTLAVLNVAVIGLLFGAATLTVTGLSATHGYGLLRWPNVPNPWRMVLALVSLDAWMYLWHRANHRVPLLWRFHRTHHSDNAVDVTSATRFHTGEQAIAATLRLALIPLIGWNLFELVVYDAVLLVATQWHHANISLGRFERPLSLVLVTPQMHKVHHSRVQVETDSNYSVVLSVWDRLGHSFRWRDDAQQIEFGLDDYDEPRWQTVTGMLKTPFVETQEEGGV